MTVFLAVLDQWYDDKAPVVFGCGLVLPAGVSFDWPRCSHCGGNLQYLGHVPHPFAVTKRIDMFMCANDPGMCGEWEPETGANRALVVDTSTKGKRVKPPKEGLTYVTGMWSGHAVAVEATSYPDAWFWARQHLPAPKQAPYQRYARVASAMAAGREDFYRPMLGQLGGVPYWIQDDETPVCPACRRYMALAAQLEEGPSGAQSVNFGGGNAYVFACGCPADQARLLWQC